MHVAKKCIQAPHAVRRARLHRLRPSDMLKRMVSEKALGETLQPGA